MKKFSIVIPAYNVEKYVKNAIKSVKSQTFKDYEIVVVEDCSIDNTLSILKEEIDIKLIEHEKNKGLGGARNSGIKNSEGEYIIFLDADDMLYDDTILKKLNNTIGDNTYDIVYSGFEARGTRNFMFIPTEEECTKAYRLAKNKFVSVCAGCWNRKFLIENNILFKENVVYEDVFFMFLAICNSNTYILANYPTFIYNTGREGSLTTKKQFKQVYDTIACIEHLCKLKDEIDKSYIPYLSERIEEQKNRLVVRLQRVIDIEFKENGEENEYKS